jgi:alcohol dehydrogenase
MEPAFTFEYDPAEVCFGRDRVSELSELLAGYGRDRALVVCGRNVGANDALMGPIERGLGDRLVGVFDETTPEKSIETAFEGRQRMAELDVDALIGVGGGSSLDVAKAMNALSSTGDTPREVRERAAETGHVGRPDADELVTLVQIPTTFAGADLSSGGGVTVPSSDGGSVGAGVGADVLMPEAVLYDPTLFETTPRSVLASSAMNGFDKGIETVYSRNRTPVTDATAVRGLRMLTEAFPRLCEDIVDPDAMDRAVVGTVLVQYGISVRSALKISVIHGYGHALRHRFGIQQGTAHAVLAPHVVEDLLDRELGRADVLADAFDIDADSGERTEAIVAEIERVRDRLGLPARLRDVEGVDRSSLGEVARLTVEDPILENGPEGYDPAVEEVECLLENAW